MPFSNYIAIYWHYLRCPKLLWDVQVELKKYGAKKVWISSPITLGWTSKTTWFDLGYFWFIFLFDCFLSSNTPARVTFVVKNKPKQANQNKSSVGEDWGMEKIIRMQRCYQMCKRQI